ncbi:hypothetical protein Tco_0993898 [Tanacetum coccineum]
MHTTMVPEQVKTHEIEAGVQVSRPEGTYDIFSIGNALEDVYFVVFVPVRNIVRFCRSDLAIVVAYIVWVDLRAYCWLSFCFKKENVNGFVR